MILKHDQRIGDLFNDITKTQLLETIDEINEGIKMEYSADEVKTLKKIREATRLILKEWYGLDL